jgi:hypothetical protein
MPSIKLNSTVLDSSLWVDVPGRNIFLTALLMARPVTTEKELVTFNVYALVETEFIVPPGLYGFVEASGKAIAQKTGFEEKLAMKALERLCAPDPDSRSKEWAGQRMARVEGGYLLLNYGAFYEKDATAAVRQKRFRAAKKKSHGKGKVVLISYNDFDIFWEAYPRKTAKATALKSWQKLMPDDALVNTIITALEVHKQSPQWVKEEGQFIPHPATWLNQRRWEDAVTTLTKSTEDVQGSWKQPTTPGVEEGQSIIEGGPFETEVPFDIPRYPAQQFGDLD